MTEDRAYYDALHQKEKTDILSQYSDLKDAPFGRFLQPVRKKTEKFIFYFPDEETCHERFTKARNINKYNELTKLH